MRVRRSGLPLLLSLIALLPACGSKTVAAVDDDAHVATDGATDGAGFDAAADTAVADTRVEAPSTPGDVGSDTPPGDVGSDTPPAPRTERIADRALVKWLSADPHAPWWIEERLAPQPMVAGDRDLGPRSLVRAAPLRTIVYLPPDTDRLTDACRHPSGEWSAAGVDADRRIFLARGTAAGLLERIVLDDPALATDTNAWIQTPRTVPRIGALSEASVKIAADGEDVIVSLMTEDFAVLAYRYRRAAGAFERGPRTLVSPARVVTPFLPIGGSYDDFDAVVSPHLTHLATDALGHAFVVQLADRGRLERHNAVFGTKLDLLRKDLGPRENTYDALVTRVDRDGTVPFSVVVGTVDVEDEVFGLTVSDERVAVLGRSRRELGRDNTELHAMIAELTVSGTPLGTTTFDATESALAQSAAYLGTDLYVGGTEGWTQNPSGRSVFTPGRPFLVRLGGAPSARTIERLPTWLPTTSGHAELRAVAIGAGFIFLGGHENGPLTHTGDGDLSLIRSDAWFDIRPL